MTDCVQLFIIFFLPALCIITTLVYFFPRKVRRSVLSSLKSLSHSPEQRERKSSFKYSMLHIDGLHGEGEDKNKINETGEKVNNRLNNAMFIKHIYSDTGWHCSWIICVYCPLKNVYPPESCWGRVLYCSSYEDLKATDPYSMFNTSPLGPANLLTAVNLRGAKSGGITVVITSEHTLKAAGPFNRAGDIGWGVEVGRLWLVPIALFVNDTWGRLGL